MMTLQLAAHFSPGAQSLKAFFACGLRREKDPGECDLEAGYDEQATGNSHDIFERGDHQIGNFEGPH